MHYPVAYRRVLQNIRLPSDDVNAFHVFPVDKNGKNGVRCTTFHLANRPDIFLTLLIENLFFNTSKTLCNAFLFALFAHQILSIRMINIAISLVGNTLTADVDYVDTWKAMEKLVQSGQVRSIGISNFNSEQTDRILSIATIKPVTNQVECHPNLNQRKLINFNAARNITITAYSPLGRPHTPNGQKLAISDPKVIELAQKYRKTPAQIILRYTVIVTIHYGSVQVVYLTEKNIESSDLFNLFFSHFQVQNGAIVIPKSTNKNRIQENFNIFDFELNDNDMQILHGLNNNYRLIDFATDKDNKYYPFNIEF